MKGFVQTLYDFNFVRTVPIIIMTKRMKWQPDIVSDSHPHGNQQLVGYNNIGTVTDENNSGEEDEMEIAVSELQPPHSVRQFVSYPDSHGDGEPCNSKQKPIFEEDFDKEIDLVLESK